MLSLYEFLRRLASETKDTPEHLERKEHKSFEDLREDISGGMQLQQKWSRQLKYLLASVDVKNPHANFGDLENSVLPEERICSIGDDHFGESLDAKKVKEARQLEMEYHDRMHVFDKSASCSILGEHRHGTPESKMG